MALEDQPQEGPDETLQCILNACGIDETPEELKARFAGIYEEGEPALARHLAEEVDALRAQAQGILDEQES